MNPSLTVRIKRERLRQRARDSRILREYVDSLIDDQRMKILRATRTRRARPLAWALLGAIVCVYLAALAASAGGC